MKPNHSLLFSAASLSFHDSYGSKSFRHRRDVTPSMPPAPGTIETCAYWYDNDGSLPNFYQWNPVTGSQCTSLCSGYNVCVGVIGQTPTPTNPGNGISTPTPIQAGMTKSCKKFRLVKSATTYASIQDYYKITMANLYK